MITKDYYWLRKQRHEDIMTRQRDIH